ncbi:hypothetical protein [Gloeomargarita lithophora]|uniref:hypothetical protein n=1 Tax=Gloeomargarita lithophora TaxID=1188228 RepID=UPI0008F90002|nr:hypothetical protein [Gloeomargarita lithophora]
MSQRTLYQSELPLGVYRELAAHCALFGIETTLLAPQTPFAYHHSQIGGITCTWQTPTQAAQLQQLLDYYAQHYQRPWQEPTGASLP